MFNNFPYEDQKNGVVVVVLLGVVVLDIDGVVIGTSVLVGVVVVFVIVLGIGVIIGTVASAFANSVVIPEVFNKIKLLFQIGALFFQFLPTPKR